MDDCHLRAGTQLHRRCYLAQVNRVASALHDLRQLDAGLVQLTLLWVGVVLVAFLVGRFAPTQRGSIKRVVVPALLATAAGMVVRFAPMDWIGHDLRLAAGHMAWLLVWILSINSVALLTFGIFVPRLGSVPRLAQEFAIGGAYLVLLFFFLQRFGVNFSSLLATSAVVTAIVAISMQATLGNAFGGLMLQLDQSVGEGDWVRLDDGSEGMVKAIRWRHTVIETRNWDTIIVPNSMLMGEKFLLLGRREGMPLQHRMWVNFNVDFRFAPADVIDAVEKGLRSAPIPNVADTPPPNCVCMDFAQPESAIRYAVRYHLTDLAVDDPTNSAVRSRIYAALRRAKIPLAVPAATLFVENRDREARERKETRKFERRLAAVERLALCNSLTTEEKERVAANLKFAPFAAGEIISHEGAAAHWLYILDRGTVEIRLHDGKRDVPITTLEAPDYFGEHGMLTGAPRAATVAATSEVECFRLDRETFDDLLRSRPEIAADIAAVLAARQEDLARSREELLADGDRISRADRELQILSKMKHFFGLS